MIPLVEEPKEFQSIFWGAVEVCYFNCGRFTHFWHWRTNQPVCKDCAKTHKVSELTKAHPKYKPPTKKEFLKSITP
jgi:hypothetical protein